MRGRRSTPTSKIAWSGELISVQPRIRLNRSFDQRTHEYLGYVLGVRGTIGGTTRDFVVAVGKGAHDKHAFEVGQRVSGLGVHVADSRMEVAELYKVSGLRVEGGGGAAGESAPPWHGVPTGLPVYRERGHRRLAARTFDTRCASCIWGCRMAVEMIIDHWNPSQRRYRTETFCYGPLSCSAYKAGPTRKVPGRRGMSYEEEDWVDEDDTRHREPDE